jgi:hypothetical protein
MSSTSVNNFPLNDLIGTKFTLLDSIRDAGFLSGNNSGQDFGLGVVDNPVFLFTTFYQPPWSTGSIGRPYPVKLFWIGSKFGTNDATDAFNIYCADVNPEQFYPGAAPAPDGLPTDSWLVNPRLVLSISQASSDIISWFDANYPYTTTPPSGGVGQETPNGQSNSTYGTLSVGGNPGNVSGFDSIDGQFWPIYDYVDNTVKLYFSCKTPNCNTQSIYCYKFTDTEFTSPATSANFLGGLYVGGWTNTAILAPFALSTVLSSHRFSILSPNRLNIIAQGSANELPTQQQGVFMYSFGQIDTTSADHGRAMHASIVTDLHANPLSPGVVSINSKPVASGQNAEMYYTPDKLGSIFPADATDSSSPGYVCVYNTPLQIDRRSGSDKIVLSAMQLRVMYYNPASGISYGSDCLNVEHTPQSVGTCRGFVTNYPDGKPKIMYANWTADNYLNMAYMYISPDAISPKKQSKLRVSNDLGTPITIYSYGKKKLVGKLILRAPTNNLATNVNALQVSGGSDADPSNGFGFGSVVFSGTKFIHTKQTYQGIVNPGASVTEFVIEDLDSWIKFTPAGPGQAPTIFAELTD